MVVQIKYCMKTGKLANRNNKKQKPYAPCI